MALRLPGKATQQPPNGAPLHHKALSSVLWMRVKAWWLRERLRWDLIPHTSGSSMRLGDCTIDTLPIAPSTTLEAARSVASSFQIFPGTAAPGFVVADSAEP